MNIRTIIGDQGSTPQLRVQELLFDTQSGHPSSKTRHDCAGVRFPEIPKHSIGRTLHFLLGIL